MLPNITYIIKLLNQMDLMGRVMKFWTSEGSYRKIEGP